MPSILELSHNSDASSALSPSIQSASTPNNSRRDDVRFEASAPPKVRQKMSAEQKEQRRLQRERKKAMLAAVHDVCHDPDTVRSPSQRVKLRLATAMVKMSKVGRKGPAEGSVLDSRWVPEIQRHVTAPNLDARALRLAMIANLSPISSESGTPNTRASVSGAEHNSWTDAIDEHFADSPRLHKQIRRWQSSGAILVQAQKENSMRRSRGSRGPSPLSSFRSDAPSGTDVGRSTAGDSPRPRTRSRSVEDRRTDPEVYVRTEAKAKVEEEAKEAAAAAAEAAEGSWRVVASEQSVDLASVTLGTTSVGMVPPARTVSTESAGSSSASQSSFRTARSHLSGVSGKNLSVEAPDVARSKSLPAPAVAEEEEEVEAEVVAVNPEAPYEPPKAGAPQPSTPTVQFALPPPTVLPPPGVVVPTGGEEEMAAVPEEEEVSAEELAAVEMMSQLVGSWKNTQTTGLEPYLKHIGVGWAKRKVALAFKPQLSFALVDGVLQCLMPSPVGERLEVFSLDEEMPDTDPVSGSKFMKRTYCEGNVLHTVARDVAGKKADFVTLRRVDEQGRLIQTNSHGPVTFERIFVRKS